MKKIITILALLICVTTKSQNPCDSIWSPISYSTGSHTFCASGTYNLNQPMATWVTINGQNCNPSSYNFSINNGPFTNTPSITFTPSAVGITTFVLMAYSTQNNTTCPQTISWTFTTIACDYTNTANSIEEYELNDGSMPIYYDLMGNVIEKRYNEVIIERRSRRFKKVLFEK